MNNNTTSTTTVPCVNIFNELVNGKYIYRNTTAALNNALSIVTKGIVRNQNCKYCCPNCGDFYFFGKATTFVNGFVSSGLFTEDDLTPFGKLECCVNYIGDDSAILDNMYIPNPADPNDPEIGTPIGYDLCTTGNFSTCMDELRDEIGVTAFNDLIDLSEGGLVEYSTIGGSSMICNFISQIKLSPVYTPSLLYAYLRDLIAQNNFGIVISCNTKDVTGLNEPNIVAGLFETWQKLVDLLGIGPLPAIPNQPNP